jgi:hypothetical protein
MKIQFYFPTFSRRQWLCKGSTDACRQKFFPPLLGMNLTEDCPRASSSTRQFATTPNVRRALTRARTRERFCRYERTQEYPCQTFDKIKRIEKSRAKDAKKRRLQQFSFTAFASFPRRFTFQKSKPVCHPAANQTAESNPRRRDGCSRATRAGRWIFGPPCRGCKCSARANPR